MRMLVSDMAGRASVELKGRELGHRARRRPRTVGRVVERVKELESKGYTFEAADASFELLLRDEVTGEPRKLLRASSPGARSSRTAPTARTSARPRSSCTPRASASSPPARATARSTPWTGPCASRLERLYPELAQLELIDYKVRILEGAHGTDAITRVLISSRDARGEWSTVGVAENVIAASWQALEEAYTYGLLRAGVEPAE